MIKNSVQVVSKFKTSIRLDLRRFAAKKFGHVCEQTGKPLFFTSPTRLDAAVMIASRYGALQSYSDGAYVNPKSLAHVHGIEMALNFLVDCGLVRIEIQDGVRTALIVK